MYFNICHFIVIRSLEIRSFLDRENLIKIKLFNQNQIKNDKAGEKTSYSQLRTTKLPEPISATPQPQPYAPPLEMYTI